MNTKEMPFEIGDVIVCAEKGQERPYKEIVYAYVVVDNKYTNKSKEEDNGIIIDSGSTGYGFASALYGTDYDYARDYKPNFVEETNKDLNGFEISVYNSVMSKEETEQYKDIIKDNMESVIDLLKSREILDENVKFRKNDFTINPLWDTYTLNYGVKIKGNADIEQISKDITEMIKKNMEYGNSDRFKVFSNYYERGRNRSGSVYSENNCADIIIRPKDWQQTNAPSCFGMSIWQEGNETLIDVHLSENRKDLPLLLKRLEKSIDFVKTLGNVQIIDEKRGMEILKRGKELFKDRPKVKKIIVENRKSQGWKRGI